MTKEEFRMTMNDLNKRMKNVQISQLKNGVAEIDIPTSAQTLLSCTHGRDRRKLRKIGKKDLQAAVKYGTKEPTSNPRTGERRYKYTYKNIVYITDETGRQEVTSYVEPIEITKAYVTQADLEIHNRLTKKFQIDPSTITSHSIFVVDQSGSMKTHDVEDYKTRSDAVFGTLALDFVGKQIDERQVQHTDCATLILMRDSSEVIINREPMDNVFFNKLLEQMKKKPSGHGNYLPALSLVNSILKPDIQGTSCPVTLFFLSDGRPSDYSPQSFADTCTFNQRLEMQIKQISRPFSDRLSFNAIGFSSKSNQFGVLKQMSENFSEYNVKAHFHAKESSQALSDVVSTISNCLQQSKTSSLLSPSSAHTLRNIEQGDLDFQALSSLRPDRNVWNIHHRFGYQNLQKYVWCNKSNDWLETPIETHTAGIAMMKKYFGKGGERIVFLLRELTEYRDKLTFLPGRFVAKESKYVEHEELKLQFHERFCKTQIKAEEFAQKFNEKISQHKKRHPYLVTADISFLKCWVFTWYEGRNQRGILVEKHLTGKYTKWNSNNGYVDTNKVLPVDKILRHVNQRPKIGLDLIQEESSDEESLDYETISTDYSCLNSMRYNVSVDDYPQAFSHFSYRYSQRKILVCDLQGVLDSTKNPPLFELTDPAIHSSSKRSSNKDKKFGRTDRGESGINKFFQTHQCNDLCKMLGIDGDHPNKM